MYRWMKATGDQPRLGDRFGLLGVRPTGRAGRSDVDAQYPTDIVLASLPKGMSCSFDPTNPQRPGDDFFLWEIDADSLGPNLAPEHAPTTNNPAHCLMKPQRDMTLFEYQSALASTQSEWRLIQVEVV